MFLKSNVHMYIKYNFFAGLGENGSEICIIYYNLIGIIFLFRNMQ